MKKLMVAVLAVTLAGGAFAHCGSCPGDKKAEAKKADCSATNACEKAACDATKAACEAKKAACAKSDAAKKCCATEECKAAKAAAEKKCCTAPVVEAAAE
jgi:hypothetical protein